MCVSCLCHSDIYAKSSFFFLDFYSRARLQILYIKGTMIYDGTMFCLMKKRNFFFYSRKVHVRVKILVSKICQIKDCLVSGRLRKFSGVTNVYYDKKFLKSQCLTKNDLRDYDGITIPYLDF
uniref:Uncharacterized protein n=1 Tax=Micrurus lemniscatus lemniscatus TaxID=129467 RepID=A0A2D4JA18_MICLE